MMFHNGRDHGRNLWVMWRAMFFSCANVENPNQTRPCNDNSKAEAAFRIYGAWHALMPNRHAIYGACHVLQVLKGRVSLCNPGGVPMSL